MPGLNFKTPDIYNQYPTIKELVEYVKAMDPKHYGTKANAMKWIRKHIPQESYYQKEILKYLESLPIPNWVAKIAQGPFSINGIPDIHFESNGRVIHFEVKRPYIGEESATQIETRERITASGGSSYVVTFVSEVKEIMIKEGFVNVQEANGESV